MKRAAGAVIKAADRSGFAVARNPEQRQLTDICSDLHGEAIWQLFPINNSERSVIHMIIHSEPN